ncbi:unnamed protein product [Ceutorhynchus assimilis]|uniref:Cell cycle checkpoint protein RAD1 n=1 Tax=Ceutorhynchus assimilis TaxID=467358 RepID=A0A9N9MQP4_9CUCU|nr:unnamed protein product [Ceutorhynchus assimilis]
MNSATMLFSAELTEVKVVHNVLKSVAMKEFAIFRPAEEGLKVTLDEMRCIETSVYIPANIFSMYHIADVDDIKFKINLNTLTNILNIFDDDGTTLKLTYKSVGSPLCVTISHGEENITVDCEMKTLNIDNQASASLAEECNLNKIVISANMFAELLQRLDNSAENLQITFCPDFPYFTLKSTSLSGISEVSLSKNADSVTIFKCKEKTDFTYAFSNIRHIIKVMHYANKVAVSTGESGLLGLQLVITSEENQMYVEYYVVSQYMRED